MIESLFRRAQTLPQPARFLIAGGTAASVNWFSRFGFSAFLPFSAAVIVAASLGMVVGFITYRSFVFPGSTRQVQHQLRDFILVNLAGMAIVAVSSTLLRAALMTFMELELAEAVAHALGIGVGAIFNYNAHRRLTFHRIASDPLLRGHKAGGQITEMLEGG